jgi:hypothetical protein
MSYEEKYLKYKIKYLELKGGAPGRCNKSDIPVKVEPILDGEITAEQDLKIQELVRIRKIAESYTPEEALEKSVNANNEVIQSNVIGYISDDKEEFLKIKENIKQKLESAIDTPNQLKFAIFDMVNNDVIIMNTDNKWNLLELNKFLKTKYKNYFIDYFLFNFKEKTIKNIVNLLILIKNLNLDSDLILGIYIINKIY